LDKVIDFLGIKVNTLTEDEMIKKILRFALMGKQKMVTYLNAHCINIALSNPEYREILNSADIVYADGMGVVWASGFLNKPLPTRINIIDFYERFLRDSVDRNISLYFLGSKPAIVQRAVDNLKKRFPKINILGFHDGYFDQTEEKKIIDEITILKPNVLLVAMGVPKQEKWVYRYRNDLMVNLYWVVGGFFDILSGFRKVPPSWVSKSGLEWFYKLLQEPRRLWRRYLIGNFVFIRHVLRWKIKKIYPFGKA